MSHSLCNTGHSSPFQGAKLVVDTRKAYSEHSDQYSCAHSCSASPSTPMSASRSNYSFSEVPQSPQHSRSSDEAGTHWISLMQRIAIEQCHAEPLSSSFINQLEYLIWEQRIVEDTPRLDDVLTYPYNIIFYEPIVQEARLQEAMVRHRATGLSWSALFQRIEYLCRFGFAELYCNTRQTTTLQVATFEKALELVQSSTSSAQRPFLDTESPFTIRQFNSTAFQEALKEVGVYQGEGALRTFVLAYSTVAYHTRSGIIEPVPQSTEELTRRLRRTFRFTPGRGSLRALHKGSLPQSPRDASIRYQQAQRRSKNRQQGQLRSQGIQTKSPKSDDGQFSLGGDVSVYSFGSSMTSQEERREMNLPGWHRSAPETSHLHFGISGSSTDFTMEPPRLPGSLSTPDCESDALSGSYLLQRSAPHPPQPLSHCPFSTPEGAQYPSDPPSNAGQTSHISVSFPPNIPEHGYGPRYESHQHAAPGSAPAGYDAGQATSLETSPFLPHEHDTAAFLASLPGGYPHRYHYGNQDA
eukprot:gb/GECG01014385.1/.p1 GENE.gb/GECG01014385.1/~~gb/GECG01014385.1/.p1  ORF type:complete len:525 (+),score=38.06 gb/GECG01014385.1/:1-1575(+)